SCGEARRREGDCGFRSNRGAPAGRNEDRAVVSRTFFTARMDRAGGVAEHWRHASPAGRPWRKGGPERSCIIFARTCWTTRLANDSLSAHWPALAADVWLDGGNWTIGGRL